MANWIITPVTFAALSAPSISHRDATGAPRYARKLPAAPVINRLGRLIPFIVLLVNALFVFAETQDDPFITFRYAANVLAGHGPVFNIGDRVEGYSSPLHLLVCCVLSSVLPSVGMLFKAKLLGLLFAVLAVVQTRLLARDFGLSEREAVLAQILAALNINFAVAAVNGLETSLYGYLLLLTFRQFLRERDAADGARSAIHAFLCILARPDAMLIVLVMAAIRGADGRRNRRGASFTIRWLALVAIPVALLFALRYFYYGTLLPNTYYAKLSLLANAIPAGIDYLSHPTGMTPPSLAGRLTFVPLFYGLAIAGWWSVRRRFEGVLLLAFVLSAIVFVLKAGGDWMPGWRFMTPMLPFFAVAQAMGIRWLTGTWTGKRAAIVFSLSASVAVLTLLAANLRSPHHSWRSIGYSTEDRALISEGTYAQSWIAVAGYIKTHTRPNDLIAYSEMGYGPYVDLDRRFLDTRGLVDRDVARMPIRYKDHGGVTDVAWMSPDSPLYNILARRQPAMIVAMDLPARRGAAHLDTPPVVLGRYRHVRVSLPDMVVYVRR
ncbi:MAG: hypothetical protein P4L33_13005 [Capsulimonadaceae bacterium]|nr:hypothetical protein [Capsulimonadaceae bacterium]